MLTAKLTRLVRVTCPGRATGCAARVSEEQAMGTKTVQVIHFNGREFRRVRWARGGARAVFIMWAVREHIRPGEMRATFIGRREA